MKTYYEIILDLETELSTMQDVSENVIDQIEFAIGHCKIALDKLRRLVDEKGFPDQHSEIKFFKHIKPAAYGKLLYYRTVFELESNRLQNNNESHRKHLHEKLERLMDYMHHHQVMVQYYCCGFKHLDEQFFIRRVPEIPLELKDSRQLLDENFFSWHDHTFSTIMANEMLADYIRKELEKLDRREKGEDELPKSHLYWTGKKIELVENLYAWYFSGSVNHGKATIKDLTEFIGWALNIDLSKDIYRYFIEIQQRKIDRTKFLDFLRSVLQQRLDDDDE